jgi:hypothetical protein
MENMERLGVPRRIVGFVMPTGYSSQSLTGTTLYQRLRPVFFVAQDGLETRCNLVHMVSATDSPSGEPMLTPDDTFIVTSDRRCRVRGRHLVISAGEPLQLVLCRRVLEPIGGRG